MRQELDFFNPWRELHRVRRNLGQLTRGNPTPLSIWIGENGAKLRAALPGIPPGNLDISVLGRVVTLRGSREDASSADNTAWLRREREAGAFSRQVELPFRVDAQGVRADYTDGMLTVTLPRAVEDKPQRITVQAA